MTPNAELLPEFNLNRRSPSKIGSKLKCCLDKKRVYFCTTYRRSNVNKKIGTPSAPIKQREALTYHQVGSCTISHARWNRTTEFWNPPNFAIPDPGTNGTILDTHWFFYRILLKVYISNIGKAGSNLIQGLTYKIPARDPPTDLFLFSLVNGIRLPLD